MTECGEAKRLRRIVTAGKIAGHELAEIWFLADVSVDAWRFGQHGGGLLIHHRANYELYLPTVATLVHDSGWLGQSRAAGNDRIPQN